MSFQKRKIVNGKLFRNFSGQDVSVMVKLEGDTSGLMVRARTTDEVPIRISLPEPISGYIQDWVEVIGVVSGPDSIRAKEIIIFEDKSGDFDFESHNMLINIMQNARDFYATG